MGKGILTVYGQERAVFAKMCAQHQLQTSACEEIGLHAVGRVGGWAATHSAATKTEQLAPAGCGPDTIGIYGGKRAHAAAELHTDSCHLSKRGTAHDTREVLQPHVCAKAAIHSHPIGHSSCSKPRVAAPGSCRAPGHPTTAAPAGVHGKHAHIHSHPPTCALMVRRLTPCV